MRPLEVVDLFCGAGGTSTGILKAITERLQRQVLLTAINHWRTAVNTHSLNHPEVAHLCENVENIHPRDLIKSAYLDLLAASTECRFHSNARGGGQCNEQSRSQPWQLIRWATDIHVENILMENVRELLNWGPLLKKGVRWQGSYYKKGRPDPRRKSEFFKAFVNAWINLGYQVDFKVQVCADYGDPTTRQRLIFIARKGKPVLWPEPTHGPGRPLPWLSARKHVIDWDLKGKSLFRADGTPRLCKNTTARIYAGFEAQGQSAEPFLALIRGTSPAHIRSCHRSVDAPLPTVTAGGNHILLCEPFLVGNGGPVGSARPQSVDDPLGTVLAQNHRCLVEPFMVTCNHGKDTNPRGRVGRRVHSLDKPLPTITTSNGFAFVQPIIVQTDQTGGNGAYCRTVDQPLATVVTKQNMILAEPMVGKYYGSGICKSVDEPLDTVTTKDRFGLIEPTIEHRGEEVRLDILVRMLQDHELSRAHSFPAHYQFTGRKKDKVHQIGNSVPVELACAHAEAALS